MEDNQRNLKGLLKAWQDVVRGTTLPHPPLYDGPDVVLTLLTEKTSEVVPGACFVARVREKSDGHPYIGKAIEKRASLILAQRPATDLAIDIPENVGYLLVADTALVSAWLAAAWEGFPSRNLVMIGITGTDGKTSTANVLFSIMKTAGLKTGLLSTIKAVFGDYEEPLALHVTTPEAPIVQKHLRRMVDAGLTHCIIEATSHGLAQYRLAAIDFDLAMVTNITHEHLDYHGDFNRYLAAKMRLFEYLVENDWSSSGTNIIKEKNIRTAILNLDDHSYEHLSALPYPRVFTYGVDAAADVAASSVSVSARGTEFVVHGRNTLSSLLGKAITISSPLVGLFNVQNMLAATTAALTLEIAPGDIQIALNNVPMIEGRMERINQGQDFPVIVDFAHTPNALEKAISATRGITSGRIITVFGSAGKRDVEKRKLMATISARNADLTILTAEDPRTESLDEILDAMSAGCQQEGGIEGETFWRVPDRGRAIHMAYTLANSGDVVLICGKGHEQSMCFGTIEYPWDDRDVARLALDRFLSGQEMLDTGLPTFQH